MGFSSVCAAPLDLGFKVGDHSVDPCALISGEGAAVTALDEIGERARQASYVVPHAYRSFCFFFRSANVRL
jgi:hypothetical protein